MKRIFKPFGLFLILIFLTRIGFAQCENDNGDIESYQNTLPSSTNTDHSNFINNYVDNWYVGYGTPDIYTSSTAPWSMGGTGNLFYMQSYNSNQPESVFTNYQFIAGKTYDLTFSLWRNTDANTTATFEVLLANGLVANSGGSYQVPTTSQVVSSLPWSHLSKGSWITVTKTFVATANFDQLFFYPESVPSDIYARAAIDNVCISEVTNFCRADAQIIGIPPTSGCIWRFYNATVLNFPTLQILDTSWDFGDGNVSSGMLVGHQFSPGNYDVCMTVLLTDGVNCCKSTVCESITITSSCDDDPCEIMKSAAFTISGSGPITVTEIGLPTTIRSIWGYYWDFGDGNIGTGKELTHSYSQTGTYDIVLTVFYSDDDGNCCSFEVSEKVTINDTESEEYAESTEYGKRNVLTLGEEELIWSVLGIKSNALVTNNTELIIKPNPSDGSFEISSPIFVEKISVMDLSGKLVFEKEVSSEVTLNESMNISFLKRGVYIVVLTKTQSKESVFEKIVIE